MGNTKSILELKNVSKIYELGGEKVFALKDVSLKISEGEFIAIVGSSGSGKSTLMNMIGVLDQPSEGFVFLKSEKVADKDKDELASFRGREVGFIFQQYNLISRLTAYENVRLTLDFLDFSFEDAEPLVSRALKLVDLYEKRNHTPLKLSGGQQQRVSIARSLVADPAIILADEPTGALDSKNGLAVMKILNDLNKQGKTVIMITHDLKLAKFAKRIVELSDGVIVKDAINSVRKKI